MEIIVPIMFFSECTCQYNTQFLDRIFFCLLRSIFEGFFSKNTPNENQFCAQNFEENNMQSRKLMTMCKKGYFHPIDYFILGMQKQK
jgi:hypothetical protein